MSRRMRNAATGAEAVLTLLGALMILAALASPSAIGVEAAILLLGFLMIATASFAGL